jgi:hypothetical protein
VHQGGGYGGHIELHVRQQMRYFHWMREVWLARLPGLRLMVLGREVIGTTEDIQIITRAIAMNFFEEVGEAEVDGM